MKPRASLQVPEGELVFDDDADHDDETQGTAARGVVLSLAYGGTEDP